MNSCMDGENRVMLDFWGEMSRSILLAQYTTLVRSCDSLISDSSMSTAVSYKVISSAKVLSIDGKSAM